MNFCLREFTHACGHHPLHAAPDGLSIENKGTDSMGRSLLFRCCAYQFPKFRTADTPFRNDLTQALVTQKHVFIENRTEAVMLATATTNHSHTCFLCFTSSANHLASYDCRLHAESGIANSRLSHSTNLLPSRSTECSDVRSFSRTSA